MVSDYDEQTGGFLFELWGTAYLDERDRVIPNYYPRYLQLHGPGLETQLVQWIKYDSSEKQKWSRLPLTLVYQNKFDMALVIWNEIRKCPTYNPTIAKNNGLFDQTLHVMMLEMAIAAIYADNVTILHKAYWLNDAFIKDLGLAHFLLAVVLKKEDVAEYISYMLDCSEMLESDREVCKHLKEWYSDYSGLATYYVIKPPKPSESKNKKYIIEDGTEWNPREALAKLECWQVGPICNLNPDDSIDIEELKWTGIDNKPFSEEFYQPEAEK